MISKMGLSKVGLFGAVAAALLSHIAMAAAEPTAHKGMFDLYDANRREGVPNYITEDFVLLSYSMIVESSVTSMEQNLAYPQLQKLVKALIEKSQAQKDQNAAAKANLEFLAVIDALLNGIEKKDGATDAVNGELAKIKASDAIASSDIAHQKVDYTQFRVRGKYTRDPNLGRYFQAVKYAGTVLFPVQESAATGVSAAQADELTAQAVALSRLIHEDTELRKLYADFNERLDYLFGPNEDLDAADLLVAASQNPAPAPAALRAALLATARKNGKQPAILGGIVDVGKLEKGLSAADVLTGWRFLPQRFSPDGAAFQQLIFDRVKTYKGKSTPVSLAFINGLRVKGFPLGLELMALLGSPDATKQLDSRDERNYEGYAQAEIKAREALRRPSGLASEHLALLSYWLSHDSGKHLPRGERRLNSALSFWTWQRYNSVLYSKQSYTPVLKSMQMTPERKGAWLEPSLELYLLMQRQAGKLHAMAGGEAWTRFGSIMDQCVTISQNEIRDQSLSADQINFLNGLDLEVFQMTGIKDAPIVVDVHTEPSSKMVLEEGLGFPQVVEQTLNKAEKARGALFTHYEFKQPMDQRLTDAGWLLKLQKDGGSLVPDAGQTTPVQQKADAQPAAKKKSGIFGLGKSKEKQP